MDPLERELRDLLSSDRLDLPASTVPLSGVHAGAVRRRHRRTALVSAAGALVLVVGALAAGWGGRLSAGPDPADDSAARASASATPEPSPDSAWGGADVLSVTATSTETFVALGATRGSCVTDCQRLAQSRDGGRTFRGLIATAGSGRPTTAGTAGRRCRCPERS